jgi:hypothetical protein
MEREAFMAIVSRGVGESWSETERAVSRLQFQIHTLTEAGIRALIAVGLAPDRIVVSPSVERSVQDGAGNELCRVTTEWSDFDDPSPGVTVRLEFSPFAAERVLRA